MPQLQLSDGWVAFYETNDYGVIDHDEIIFRRFVNGIAVEYVSYTKADITLNIVIPYSIIREFVVEQIRMKKIKALENASADQVVGMPSKYTFIG